MVSINLPDSLVGTLLPAGARRDDYTAEEARNVEHAISLRFAAYEDRASFHTSTGEPPHRWGFQGVMQDAKAAGHNTSMAIGLSQRRDEFIDLIAKDDRVWVSFRVHGTHTGELYGFPPTGREVSVLEFGVYRFDRASGLIAEAFYFGDDYDFVRQLRGDGESLAEDY